MNSLKKIEMGLGRKLTYGEIEGQFIMTELCRLQEEITKKEYLHVRNELMPRLMEEIKKGGLK